VSAVFAGLLTKVGVYALIRVLTLVFPSLDWAFRALVAVASLTMVAGVLGAVAQFHVRRVIGWHIVSQIGYMVLGLALVGGASPGVARLALAATVFYLAHHILVKTNLFLIAGVIRAHTGSEELKGIGGLARTAPWLAALFLVPAGSLAGIPPLSGFWAKLAVLRAGLEAGEWLAVTAALGAGLLTLMSMVKIWHEAFWKPAPEDAVAPTDRPRLGLRIAPIAVLAGLTVILGLVPGPLFELAGRAADVLLDPEAYRLAVALAGRGGLS
jgi:multicomponent Na+:H+ antiporter subunit D